MIVPAGQALVTHESQFHKCGSGTNASGIGGSAGSPGRQMVWRRPRSSAHTASLLPPTPRPCSLSAEPVVFPSRCTPAGARTGRPPAQVTPRAPHGSSRPETATRSNAPTFARLRDRPRPALPPDVNRCRAARAKRESQGRVGPNPEQRGGLYRQGLVCSSSPPRFTSKCRARSIRACPKGHPSAAGGRSRWLV
jgi:hypothetical protein